MGAAVDAVEVKPDWVGALAAKAGAKLDLLLIDPAPPGFAREAVAALSAEAWNGVHVLPERLFQRAYLISAARSRGEMFPHPKQNPLG